MLGDFSKVEPCLLKKYRKYREEIEKIRNDKVANTVRDYEDCCWIDVSLMTLRSSRDSYRQSQSWMKSARV